MAQIQEVAGGEAALALARLGHHVRLGPVDYPPAAGLEALQWRLLCRAVQPLGPEPAPVVGLDGAQSRQELIEVIGYDLRRARRPAEERLAEIVEALAVVGELPDEHVGFKP